MSRNSYDLVVAGGGLAGSALAVAMAGHGARVLVIEREDAFKDRVRGEGMAPWGVVEAQALGIYDTIRDACGHEVRWFETYAGPVHTRRDLVETTAQRAPMLGFFHPEMQEVLLGAASAAGAEVRRGAIVNGLVTGDAPRVIVEHGGKTEEVSARMVVGADGRSSRMRSWAGFALHQDPHRLFVGGVLFDGLSSPVDAVALMQGISRTAIFYPQRAGRVRAYVVYHRDLRDTRLQGAGDLPQFIDDAVKVGTPPEWFAGARAIGPLATFEGAHAWVEHPYRQGVALIGDAAAAADPSWGQGLSLTLRDVRVLRDHLLKTENSDAAGDGYAAEHDGYYDTLHKVEDWYTRLFMEVGPAADARRARAIPLIMADPTRVPDVLISGPNQPLGEEDRIRLFGE
jgi:2-polyprenyl-6-methoxyphenol hydroxylase-like FAD-dependent oxidoreductase